MQMEGTDKRIRQLAYDIRAHEQMEQKRRSRQNFYGSARGRNNRYQSWGTLPWFNDGESTSGCLRGFKKRGNQAIGRSRGGLTTKIHTIAASDKFALKFSLSANDSPQGMRLLFFTPAGSRKQYLLMDRAYSGKKMRSTAKKFINGEMRLSYSFGGWSVSGVFSLVMTSWTLFLPVLYFLLLFLIL